MVGLSSGDATRKIMELNDPQKQADRNALIKSPDTEKWLKDTATENDARNVFYPGFFSTNFTPKLGETPAQAAAATAEYRDILQESLVDTNGDKELAKTLAGERFRSATAYRITTCPARKPSRAFRPKSPILLALTAHGDTSAIRPRTRSRRKASPPEKFFCNPTIARMQT